MVPQLKSQSISSPYHPYGRGKLVVKNIFFDVCKKVRLSQRAKSPGFIDLNPAFFTKIHVKNKACQSHHALEIARSLLVGLSYENCTMLVAKYWMPDTPALHPASSIVRCKKIARASASDQHPRSPKTPVIRLVSAYFSLFF